MGQSLAGGWCPAIVGTTLRSIVSFDPKLAVLRVAGDEDRSTSGLRRRPLSAAPMATRDVSVELAELHFADPS
jgi:hypothetical protein